MRQTLYTLATIVGLVPLAAAQQNNGGGQSQGSATTSATSAVNTWSSDFDAITFENLGFTGYYRLVDSISDIDTDQCTCELSTKKTNFKGKNAPLNEELSVHFRGPLQLLEFGYYVADDFVLAGGSSTSNWTRKAYYDSNSQTATNVTFTNTQGTNATCLGKALTYASQNGLNASDSSQVLADNVTIPSNSEFQIFSSVACGASGKDCGVYRDGIPAYHGFYGITKMFLFRFKAPNDFETPDTELAQNKVAYPNIPAIWLLNSNIPRTAQYPPNSNCSCWESGCGEFDVFEVMNKTDQYRFYSTLHTYQQTDYLATGTMAEAYIARTPETEMIGGVVFDSNGTVSVFVSNDTRLDSTIPASSLYSWISNTTTGDHEEVLKAQNGGSFFSPSTWTVVASSVTLLFFLFA